MNGAEKFYHGGPGGIVDRILPASVTKAPLTMNHYATPEERLTAGYRNDRVYLTPSLETAILYASVWPLGVVYEVKPEGPMEDDPDCTERGLSFTAPSARIVRRFKVSARTRRMVGKALLHV